MALDPVIAYGIKPPEVEDPLAAYGKVMSLRNMQMQQQNMAQQQQMGAIDLKRAQRQDSDDAATRDAFSSSVTTGPDGQPTVDTGKALSKLYQGGQYQSAFALQGTIAANKVKQLEAQQKALDVARSKNAAIGQAAGAALNAPPEQQQAIWSASRANLINQGLIDPEHAPEQFDPTFALTAFRSSIDADKQLQAHQDDLKFAEKQKTDKAEIDKNESEATKNTEQAIGQWRTRAVNAASAATGQSTLDATRQHLKEQGAPDSVLAEIPTVWSPAAMQQLATSAITPAERATLAGQAQSRAEVARHNRADEAHARALTENMSLSPEATDKMATMFATTGTLPNLGMGASSAALRTKIINRASEMYKSVDFASNAAVYKANKDSLNNVTKTLDTLSAFESAGLKNLKMFTDAAAKIPDTGVPWLNTPIRLLDDKLVGSTNMAVVKTARSVALREIARVTNDPKLSGVLSDSARHEVQDFNPENATFAQTLAVSKALQKDMANVHTGLQEQKDAISNRIGINPAAPGGTVKMAAPDGTTTDVPAAQVDHYLKLGAKRVAEVKP